MSDLDRDVIDACNELIRASESAREELVATELALRRAVELVESGRPFTDGLRSFPVARRREATQTGIENLIRARHEFRLAFMERSIEDGLGPRELGEIWGVSRQRIDQYLQELKKRRLSEADLGHTARQGNQASSADRVATRTHKG